MSRFNDKIPSIVFTGGPCGGKTCMVSLLKQELEDKNWRVFVIPEMATLFYSNGVRPQEAVGAKNVPFRLTLMRSQFAHEQAWREMAKLCPHAKRVVIQDRGLF